MEGTKRNVALLATCQGLLLTNLTTFMLIGALVAHPLLEAKELATLPMTTFWLGGALTTIPASMLMKRIGRRNGFMVGALLGVAGGAVCAYAVYIGSFWVLCLGAVVMGCYYAFGQYYRFAAVEVADEAFRSRAISLVVAGGIIGAFLGPETARWTRELFGPAPFFGAFASLSAYSLVTVLLLGFVRMPAMVERQESTITRPLSRIAMQPAFIVAVLAGTLGYAASHNAAVVTPLAMQTHGLPFGDASFVIEWYVVGMFAPGFIAGAIIARFGVLNVISLGVLLLFVAVAFAVTGVELWNFWWAVFLIGVGWSLLFIGGTSLISECCTPGEKAKAQGFNDFMMFVALTTASLAAGFVFEFLSWNAIAWITLLMAVLIGAPTLWLMLRQRQELRQVL